MFETAPAKISTTVVSPVTASVPPIVVLPETARASVVTVPSKKASLN